MQRQAQQASVRTKVMSRALLIASVAGLGLMMALLICLAADLLGPRPSLVEIVFPTIVELLVYDAALTLLLRLALGVSRRLDRRP